MEDHLPIKGALIHTNTNHWARTLYTGQFAMKYAFDSAKITKQGYLPLTIYIDNLPDTVFLLPEAKQIDEVTIYGEGQNHVNKMTEKIRQAAKEAATPANGLSLDILGVLDSRGRRDAKHHRKAIQIIKEHEEAGDPIVNAYNKTMQELRGANAPKAKPDGSGIIGDNIKGEKRQSKDNYEVRKSDIENIKYDAEVKEKQTVVEVGKEK